MQIADRVARLGTETAFAVSAEAAAFAARGNKIYPFHLGDMNIITPANIIEAAHKAMIDGKTGYCSNFGIAPLREALAADINASHTADYTIDNVAIQPGGKPVIGKFILAMMNPGDEVLYPNPGYPIYESMIEFHGGKALAYGYTEGEENYRIDIAGLRRLISPKTKLLIINDLQNPTGAECSDQEYDALRQIVLENDLTVLVDEAYFDIRYEGASRSFASLPDMAERCLILYTFAKKFAMTGWRLGAAVGPTEIVDVIAKLNVNDESCSNHFNQYGAIEALTGDQSGAETILEILKERRDVTVDGLNAIDGVHCFCPHATFYLFPNVTDLMKRRGFDDYDAFRRDALEATGVSFCTRLHFGRALPGETNRYIRFAYSGIDVPDIRDGLAKLKAYWDS
ncbi:MAG TPA: aminotransferase class I/II-fold pyridoxal phosphate-dependent enzyme [Aurantimonas coralicida]|uniref:aspartate transaminase n=1 Tax=Aurantimonas coralicida TaxID=182270 RepID=A0A9C9NCR9_9HYPH|nr:aminotransferase class I/II-fold pyridoxal phosphate-dependent enzyme [Phycisphaerae bacterium]HET98857.1 aminotransferase class I/II-fold pyridoxal phosphate-dependent enzyme [Aurantimonas coralicida]